jgi:sec-independent protein translocase protein TatA
MFGIGMPELVIVLAIAFLIFGAKSLPELGSGLGKAIRGFKDASEARPAAQPVALAYTCPHCGNGYKGEAAFCPQCGKGLAKA